LMLLAGSLAIVVVTEFHGYSWSWGDISDMNSGDHTRKLILSGGELEFRCADDWPTPAPAPAWQEGEIFDYNVDLGIIRFFRLREIWWLGERPAGGLSLTQRVTFPHFYYGRHGWDVDFMPASFVFTVPVVVATLLAVRTLVRARRHKGLCRNCGYDLRGTPDCCPECGLVADAAKNCASAGVP